MSPRELTQTVEYNKLVRDNMIQIIAENPKVVGVSSKVICSKHNMKPLLMDKLQEECKELIDIFNSNGELSLEELADVLEVVDAIKSVFNVNDFDLDTIKKDKKLVKGGFELGTYLESVTSYKK